MDSLCNSQQHPDRWGLMVKPHFTDKETEIQQGKAKLAPLTIKSYTANLR